MGISRHEHVNLVLRAFCRHVDQRLELGGHRGAELAKVEPQVRHDLVVPGAAGVHLSASGSDELCEPALVGSVNVLIALLHLEHSLRPLLPHELKASHNGLGLSLGQHATPLEGAGVGDRAVEVDGPHDAVDVERVVETLHHRVSLAGEPAAPQL
eukprot:scaffold230398_cov35-Tisochrysis_lutea.AAC.1